MKEQRSSNNVGSVVTVMPMLCLAVVLTGLVAGCHTPYPCSQRHVVAGELQSRFGSGIGPGGGLQAGSVPAGVTIDDGLTSDEAVALTLWNNAAYGEMLAQLGVSGAQLFDAGLITDPQFVILFPLGPKQLEFTTFQAVDALWLRPIRKRAAELDLCQLSRQMVQNGLNTVRDVRVAHANLLLAQERAELTHEAHDLREQIASLSQKRLDAGDISELEASSSRIEALQAEASAASAVQDVVLAQQQLRTLMGLPVPTEQVFAVDDSQADLPIESAEDLVATALAMRPDLRAIEIQSAAACKRAELARHQFMNLDVIFDANGSGTEGFEAGPGLRFTLPVFNGNKGGIAIADAQVQQVNHQYVTLRDRIELEVQTAFTQLRQSEEQRRMVDEGILPALAEAEELARRNYEDGGVPYFLVLQTTGQYIDAKLRRIDAAAGVRRATAELERSVGRKLQPTEAERSPAMVPHSRQTELPDQLP